MTTNSSETLAVFSHLLNLPDIKVTAFRNNENDEAITFTVKSTREYLPCRQCGKLTRGHVCVANYCLSGYR